MYKELIISVFIISSIFILDYISQRYTDKAINESIQDLVVLKENINKDNTKNLIEDINKKYNKWLEFHRILAFFIEHNELEKVETNYVTGKSYIESENYKDALSEIEKTIFIMQHINDKYSVNLENIF